MNWYRNINIRAKLVLGFCSVLLLTLIISVVGILELSALNDSDDELYRSNTIPMVYLGTLYDSIASERICLSNMAIFRETDPAFAEEEAASLKEKEAQFEETLELYHVTIGDDPDEIAIYNSIYNDYHGVFKTAKANVISALATGDEQVISEAVMEMDSLGSQVSGYMDEAFVHNEAQAKDKVDANTVLFKNGRNLALIILALSIILGYLIAAFISRTVRNPLALIKNIATQAGETGDLTFTDEQVAEVKKYAELRDELGQLCKSFAMMMDAIIEKAKIIERVSHGDLTPKVDRLSDSDTLGNAVYDLLENLNGKFNEISRATVQVATGAGEMATGAQSLAQASTEQAGTVENLSMSVREISDKTRDNTARAGKASDLANTIKDNAEDGAKQMERLSDAVNKINESSQAIGSVIKVIDSIAFQTNILALNAAVEAARAGQHGKGFAVVAEEVRNLAGKSAEAASDSGSLIADSIEKAKLGAKIAEETAAALSKIVEGINESTVLVGEIAKSSGEQNLAIEEVNNAISQVTQVVQQNSAIAEQSAAASEEISGQSSALQALIDTFELADSSNRLGGKAEESKYLKSASADFGKY